MTSTKDNVKSAAMGPWGDFCSLPLSYAMKAGRLVQLNALGCPMRYQLLQQLTIEQFPTTSWSNTKKPMVSQPLSVAETV
jgi:hypothetical protein